MGEPFRGSRVAFPGASVEEQRLRDPERLLAVVTGAKTPALGDVMITLEANGKGRLHLIEYSYYDAVRNAGSKGAHRTKFRRTWIARGGRVQRL
jgi:hypothetical protein